MIILHPWAPCKDTLAAWLPKASLKRSCLENETIRKKMSECLWNAARLAILRPRG